MSIHKVINVYLSLLSSIIDKKKLLVTFIDNLAYFSIFKNIKLNYMNILKRTF